MDSVAKLPSEERAALFRETAAKMGLGSSVIPEKDFWACFALRHLFAFEFSVPKRTVRRLPDWTPIRYRRISS